MGRDVSTKIIIFSAADGRVRLTTKNGVTFDARLLRWEHKPKHVAVIQPIGVAVSFGEFVPEVLRVAVTQIVDAGRVEAPAAAPDGEKLRKAIEWPVELGPKPTAAAVKRAEAALAAADFERCGDGRGAAGDRGRGHEGAGSGGPAPHRGGPPAARAGGGGGRRR
ncbi:hypothetical protein [Nannocystis pusilla]|uniref:hypothetical protein n=1 Tax=Nannocystis pusilla TaxID=889268 RepID=UPI003DA304A1